MKNSLTYKGFTGSVQYDAVAAVFYGKIEEIDDLAAYEGDNIEELINAFHDAVDDYIYICADVDKPLIIPVQLVNVSTVDKH
ncbi:MAG: antitoxin HicB [Nitrospirae bacterium]|nr:antitoxin HicB [Nitrospirota bacterium]